MLNLKFIQNLCAFTLLCLGSSAFAQDWTFTVSDEQGQPNDTVTLVVTIEHTGTTEAFSVDLQVADTSQFSNVDFSNCMATFPPAFIQTCGFRPAPNDDFIRIQWSSATPGVPWPASESATIDFTIDGAATTGNIVPITIDNANVAGDTTAFNDGSIEIVSGPPAVLDVSPPAINFGTGVAPTTLGPETVTIANAGAAGAPDLTVNTLGFSGATPGQFSIAGGSCAATPFDLAQGASCTVDIELDANAVAVFTADFDVDSSAGADSVALTGEGTAGPQSTLTITPDPMAFGTVDLGNLPVTDTFVAENTGDAGSSLTIASFTLGGDVEFSVAADGCTGATLNAGDTCSVDIEFDSAVNGMFNGTGSFVSNANSGANQDIAISGEADSVANLVINPPFGPVNLGLGAPGDIVSANGSVENTGSASGDFSCVLGGPDAAIFSTAPDPLVGPVAAGDTLPFTLSCAIPTAAGEGDVFSATLTCTGDLDGTHELTCGASLVPVIPVPTMQPWALALFALMMLIVGGFSIRYFRTN